MLTIRHSALALLLASSMACSGLSSKSAEEHMKRGDSYLAEGKTAEAIVEYRSAVQANDKLAVARQKLAEAYLAVGDGTKALQELTVAADLTPEDNGAQIRLGHVLLMAGRFDDARSRADKVLARAPKDVEAHLLKGNALAGLRDVNGAVTQLQEAIKSDPTKGIGYSSLGSLQLARGDVEQAEISFKQALAAEPNSASVRLAMASLFWSTRRQQQAEDSLKEAVRLEPTNVMAQRALAMLYLGTKRLDEAEAPLKAAASTSKLMTDRLALADYYADRRKTPEAKALYEEISATREGAVQGKLRLATLNLLDKDRAGAYQIVEGIVKERPKDVSALVAHASLLFGDNKFEQALEVSRRAVNADNRAPMAHFLVGRSLAALYQREDAVAAFKQAITASPAFAPAYMELATIEITMGQYAAAVGHARTAIQYEPRYAEAYLVLSRALVATGDVKGAALPVRLLSTNFPDSPAIQGEVGRFLLASGDIRGATEAFNRALAKDPSVATAIEGLAAIDVHEKRVGPARQRLEAAMARFASDPEIHLVAARLFARMGDSKAAEAAVRKSISLDQNNLDAYSLLAELYLKSNNLAAATAEFKLLAQKQPQTARHQTVLGVLQQVQNDLPAAKAAYEQAVKLDPNSFLAANNLAQLLSDRNESLDRALELAKTAKQGLPKSHEVDDTLGWLYYKKGLGFMAVAPLRAAVAAQPDNAVYLYHLGAAYALNKEKSNARSTLEKALKRGSFPEAAEARKLLESLK